MESANGTREEKGGPTQGREKNRKRRAPFAAGGLAGPRGEGFSPGIEISDGIDSGDRTGSNPVASLVGGMLRQMRDEAATHLARCQASVEDAEKRVRYFDELIQGLDDDAAEEAE